VAARTGVSVAALRAWERRFGFPRPERVPSGHRRFTAEQVEQVRQVVRDRDAGWSLEAAIERVRGGRPRAETSIFAALRRQRPDLAVHELAPRAMLAISRAIEDECCARAERGVLLGSFERIERYRRSEPRWRELARTATVTVVFADFAKTRVRRGEPTEVALGADAPLLREWAVVCDAPDAAACLAGVERPPARRGRGRRVFEAVWSVEPAVVRDATEAGLRLAHEHAPRLGEAASLLPPWEPAEAAAVLRRAGALTSRIVAYLERDTAAEAGRR
jgi:DNA-binding transcriptional MerR regulator